MTVSRLILRRFTHAFHSGSKFSAKFFIHRKERVPRTRKEVKPKAYARGIKKSEIRHAKHQENPQCRCITYHHTSSLSYFRVSSPSYPSICAPTHHGPRIHGRVYCMPLCLKRPYPIHCYGVNPGVSLGYICKRRQEIYASP